jgi:quinoprotein glucose dehydrogenase
LYVFGRVRGEALFPISEKRVPASLVPGDQASPTQPFSSLPALVAQSAVRPDDAWGITFWDRGECRRRIASLRNEGIFTPPDTRGTLESPGYLGGVDWGGMVFDEQRQRVIAAVNHLPVVVRLLPAADPQRGTAYSVLREPLLSRWGLPCTAPPWGTLVSVDLRRQRIVWQVPLGSSAGVTPWWLPARDFGMPNMGGPIATAGDLVFVAAATDGILRALDIETGRELWQYQLPAGGQATPMTYRAGPTHRQYVLISAGGHGVLGTLRGDYVLAFALPAE